MGSDVKPSESWPILVDGERRYLLSPEKHTILMGHGLLGSNADGTFRLSDSEEMQDDPGSAGVNNPKPLAVLAVVRAALAASLIDTPMKGEGDDDTKLLAILANDPSAVHINLLRGSLARPTVEQIIHVYGAEAIRKALPAHNGDVVAMHRFRPIGADRWTEWRVGKANMTPASGCEWEDVDFVPALAAAPQSPSGSDVKIKPIKWQHFPKIGAAGSPEQWFANLPEGGSVTVTFEEDSEFPWVARPFPPGASNYLSADEAKAALEAQRDTRIRSALA